MKWLKNAFNSVRSFFGKLFDNDPEEFMALIEKVSPLVNKAYPIVKKIAALTPNKTDDAILAAYESLGFVGVFQAGTDKGLALRDLAKKVLVASSPDPVTDYLANTAIELAYAKFKESLKNE
jgi:phosphoglycerate dehydrogenase-like enzyme